MAPAWVDDDDEDAASATPEEMRPDAVRTLHCAPYRISQLRRSANLYIEDTGDGRSVELTPEHWVMWLDRLMDEET